MLAKLLMMYNTNHVPDDVKFLHPQNRPHYTFSICTLMTRPDQYSQMVQSFRDAGFGKDCEFLCVNNSQGNVYDAFSGYNAFLVEAQGEYIILSHQDIVLCFDDRSVLEKRLRELTEIDSAWGVCGNSGGVALGQNAIRISDPHCENCSIGTFPQRVFSLDENFMVVRRSANLCLSRDMSGYHMYGPDLCAIADVKGDHCYVIDFHLRHLSGGTLDSSFRTSADAFSRKYARAFRPRWMQTSVTAVFLSGESTRRVAAMIWRALGFASKLS
jgi:hypothetical protein